MPVILAENCVEIYKKFMEFYGPHETIMAREKSPPFDYIIANRVSNGIGVIVSGVENSAGEDIDPNAVLAGHAWAFASFLCELQEESRQYAMHNFSMVVNKRVAELEQREEKCLKN